MSELTRMLEQPVATPGFVRVLADPMAALSHSEHVSILSSLFPVVSEEITQTSSIRHNESPELIFASSADEDAFPITVRPYGSNPAPVNKRCE